MSLYNNLITQVLTPLLQASVLAFCTQDKMLWHNILLRNQSLSGSLDVWHTSFMLACAVLYFIHVLFTFSSSRTISFSFACTIQWWAVHKRHRIAVGQQVAEHFAPEINLAYFTHFTFRWLDSKYFQTYSPHFEIGVIFTPCFTYALLFTCLNSGTRC